MWGLSAILNFELAVPFHFKISPQAKIYGVPFKISPQAKIYGVPLALGF
jgi:hypothetical protein